MSDLICVDCKQYGKCMAGQGVCVLEDAQYLDLRTQLDAANVKLSRYDEAAKIATVEGFTKSIGEYANEYRKVTVLLNQRRRNDLIDVITAIVAEAVAAKELNQKYEVFCRDKNDKLSAKGLCPNDGSTMVIDRMSKHLAEMHCPECGYTYSGPSRNNENVSVVVAAKERAERCDAVVEAARKFASDYGMANPSYHHEALKKALDALDNGGTNGQ